MRSWEEPHDEVRMMIMIVMMLVMIMMMMMIIMMQSVYCLATDHVNLLVTGTARHGRVR